jgi:hypothetical protein
MTTKWRQIIRGFNHAVLKERDGHFEFMCGKEREAYETSDNSTTATLCPDCLKYLENEKQLNDARQAKYAREVEVHESEMAKLRKRFEVEIGKPLTDKQWGAIAYKAYEQGHSAGYQEVYAMAQDLLDMVKELLT